MKNTLKGFKWFSKTQWICKNATCTLDPQDSLAIKVLSFTLCSIHLLWVWPTYTEKSFNYPWSWIYWLSAWVKQPERPKGVKDEVKRPKGLQLEVRAQMAPILLSYLTSPTSGLSSRLSLRVAQMALAARGRVWSKDLEESWKGLKKVVIFWSGLVLSPRHSDHMSQGSQVSQSYGSAFQKGLGVSSWQGHL